MPNTELVMGMFPAIPLVHLDDTESRTRFIAWNKMPPKVLWESAIQDFVFDKIPGISTNKTEISQSTDISFDRNPLFLLIFRTS